MNTILIAGDHSLSLVSLRHDAEDQEKQTSKTIPVKTGDVLLREIECLEKWASSSIIWYPRLLPLC